MRTESRLQQACSSEDVCSLLKRAYLSYEAFTDSRQANGLIIWRQGEAVFLRLGESLRLCANYAIRMLSFAQRRKHSPRRKEDRGKEDRG